MKNVLRPKIRQRTLDMLAAGVLIFHDNARPHIALTMRETFDKIIWMGSTGNSPPPYRPDLSPPDFVLSPKPKKPLHGNVLKPLMEFSMRGDLSNQTAQR